VKKEKEGSRGKKKTFTTVATRWGEKGDSCSERKGSAAARREKEKKGRARTGERSGIHTKVNIERGGLERNSGGLGRDQVGGKRAVPERTGRQGQPRSAQGKKGEKGVRKFHPVLCRGRAETKKGHLHQNPGEHGGRENLVPPGRVPLPTSVFRQRGGGGKKERGVSGGRKGLSRLHAVQGGKKAIAKKKEKKGQQA